MIQSTKYVKVVKWNTNNYFKAIKSKSGKRYTRGDLVKLSLILPFFFWIFYPIMIYYIIKNVKREVHWEKIK